MFSFAVLLDKIKIEIKKINSLTENIDKKKKIDII